jgi:serine/threonine protein kinase
MAVKCPKCKTDNPDKSSFRADCGTDLSQPSGAPVVTKTLETPLSPLSKGETLADRYEIKGELGRGGMGEVYLAEDRNLKRQVAVKVLPQPFALDKERLSRFEREARLLASLNHPNIATIHGLEKSDGRQFLIMELVEGETLQEKISKGPMDLREALEICKQVAEGLESAHEKGIIHRDLKPGNVKVTPEGQVKILDFGIAMAFQKQTGKSDTSKSPVITDEMTGPGVILGTASYMSPEQAKGNFVDKRADIWAFGCILYECLAGKKVFKGDSASEVMASILKDKVDLKDLPNNTPLKIREVVSRCLVKDVRNRLHDIADARIVIQECLVLGSEAEIQLPRDKRSKFPWKSAAIIAAGFALGSVLTYFFLSSKIKNAYPSSMNKYELVLETNKILFSTDEASLAISPDGSGILFAIFHGQRSASLGLFDFETKQHRNILPDVFRAVYSPTGHILFTRKDGLYAVSFDLKTHCISDQEFPLIRDLYLSEFNVGKFSLSDTGTLAYIPGVPRPHELIIVDLEGSIIETIPSGPGLYNRPRFSPDAKKIAVEISEPGKRKSYIIDRESGRLTPIISEGSTAWPKWVPEGKQMTYVSDRSGAGQWKLYREFLDDAKVEVLLKNRISGRNAYNYSWSKDGRFLLVACDLPSETEDSALWGNAIAYLDLETPGELIEVIPASHPMHRVDPALSPGGKWLAYTEAEVSRWEFAQIWVVPFPGGGRPTLISKGYGHEPLWSPDEKHIYYISRDPGDRSIKEVDIRTEPEFLASPPRILFEFQKGWSVWDLSTDGEYFIVRRPVGEEHWRSPSHINIDEGLFDVIRDKEKKSTY